MRVQLLHGMDKTTLTVTPKRLERFNKMKAEATAEDMPEQSADLFLKSLMDTWDAVDDGHYDSDTRELVEELKNELSMANDPGEEVDISKVFERIDELEAAIAEATNAAQNAEKAIEELQP